MTACILFLALHAPAPIRQPPTRAAIVGSWDAQFAGVPCVMEFHADGTYHGIWQKVHWYGSWRFDPRTQQVSVEEVEEGIVAPRHCNWVARMTGQHRGILYGYPDGGNQMRLLRRTGYGRGAL